MTQLDALIDQLREVLEEERQALLRGTPSAISAVTERKTRLAEEIEAATGIPGVPLPASTALSALARYNQENAVICAAILRHLTDAIDRLHQHEPHRSYNSDGSEQSCAARHALGAA
ncbi:MAG: hypothetical protein JO032_07600 [Alphaproteobacteria bacterium]|nr:hypothetical protein [Alphaproteobacteria bacterium]MBV9552639.1 hypothetical protein [Alphaproteobacteria bacterium]